MPPVKWQPMPTTAIGSSSVVGVVRREGVVEDSVGSERLTGGGGAAVAQLNTGELAEAEILERPERGDRGESSAPEDRRGRRAHEVEQARVLVGGRQSGEPGGN